MQKNLGVSEVNLKCASDADCVFLPFGHKLCGGPVSYLLVSLQDPKFAAISEQLTKFTSLDEDFQNILYGFAGTCDYVVPAKSSCQNNICASM